MQRFWQFAIYPSLERIQHLQHIIEIGADTGLNTQKILQYCLQRNCKLTSIDPSQVLITKAGNSKRQNIFNLFQN